MSAPNAYAQFAQPPTAYTALTWTGENLAAVRDYLGHHGLTADVVPSGSNLFLLMPNAVPSSMTYAAGTAVVLFNSGDGWHLDPARTNTINLVPWHDLYATGVDDMSVLADEGTAPVTGIVDSGTL